MSLSFRDPRTGETAKVRDLRDAPINPWGYPTVAAVGPKGQIVIRHLTPDTLGEIGDVPIRVMDGAPVLSPRYARAGWVMYHDLCAGNVPGVDADPDAWKRWQSLIAYNARGEVLPRQLRDDDKLLHPEVARRRRDGGVGHMPSVAEFKAQFPGYEFDDEQDDEPASKKGKG